MESTSPEPTQNTAEEIRFPVEYSDRASNLLLGALVIIYIPLILSPLLLIPFNLATAGIMSVLLLALAFGIYVFRGNPSKKIGVLVISPGDTRIEGKRTSTLVVRSKGLSTVNFNTLISSRASLFETRIVFMSEDDCKKAHELLKQYY